METTEFSRELEVGTMNYRTRGYTIFSVLNYAFLTLLSLACILPLIHVLAVSFSNSWAATANIVTFLPIDPTLVAYKQILTNITFIHALQTGIIRTVLGTLIAMVLVTFAAYSLSKSDSVFKGRSAYAWYFVFPMLFSGGLIPTYLVVQGTGLMDTIWALIIPSAVNIWILILLLNFFKTIPKELEEAAYIDGANHIITLFRIYLPISKPGIATMVLFTLVFHWNSWFDGLIYMNDVKHYPAQTYLQILLEKSKAAISVDEAKHAVSASRRSIYSAQIFMTMVPIILLYPFLQKYFAKGMILGSVKE